MSSFQVRIRIGISTLFTFLIIIGGGMIITLSYLGSKNSLRTLADNILTEISSHVVDRTIHYLSPASKFSRLTRQMLSQGITEDWESNIQLFDNIMSVNKQFRTLYFGDTKGNFYLIKKMPDDSHSYQVIANDGKNIVTKWIHNNPKYRSIFPDKVETAEIGYDHRRRPWYKKALKTNKEVWTDVYFFLSDGKPLITNSSAIYDKNGNIKGVVGVDIGIIQLSYFLDSLKIGKKGKAFLIDQNDHLIARPIGSDADLQLFYDKKFKENKIQYEFKSLDYIQESMFSQSFNKYKQEKKGNSNHSFKFSYEYEGEKFIALYTELPKEIGLPWVIGVVLPEEDFMDLINRNNEIIIMVSIALLLLTILAGFIFSSKITKPLTSLSNEMEKVGNFELEPKQFPYSFLEEVNTMTSAFQTMKSGLTSFQKYVPSDVVKELVKQKKVAVLGGERKDVTIFFSDIVNFTAISESIMPEELVDSLAVYFTEMSNIITGNHGTVDKYIGDSIMAFWGAPKEIDDHAVVACKAALEFRRKLKLLLEKVDDGKQIPPFNTRIGLDTGNVVVGNIGSGERLNYTVIGDSVNLASRIESLNRYYETDILISENTYQEAKEAIEVRQLDIVNVKGKHKSVGIYELVAEKDQIDEETKSFLSIFNKGFREYKRKEWKEALKFFEEAQLMRSDDRPTDIMIKRCHRFIASPPGEKWSGAITMRNK